MPVAPSFRPAAARVATRSRSECSRNRFGCTRQPNSGMSCGAVVGSRRTPWCCTTEPVLSRYLQGRVLSSAKLPETLWNATGSSASSGIWLRQNFRRWPRVRSSSYERPGRTRIRRGNYEHSLRRPVFVRECWESLWVRGIGKFLAYALIAPIRLYQLTISPMLGDVCRYHPSCSTYAVEALQTHGPVKGLTLLTYRLVRCTPLTRGGLDPVPPRGLWRPEIHPDGRPRVTKV